MTNAPRDSKPTAADFDTLRDKLVAFGRTLPPGEELALRFVLARALQPDDDVQGLGMIPSAGLGGVAGAPAPVLDPFTIVTPPSLDTIFETGWSGLILHAGGIGKK